MSKDKIVFAVGFFDGVHIGHQALLSACRDLADKLGCRAGVVTFSSHPDALVSGTAPKLINTAADRRALLTAYGMDCVVELPFDKVLMQMPWQKFFRLLVETYQAAGLVCGYDFRFGDKGQGNGALLQQACREKGMPCLIVPEQKLEGITVSSTYIRKLLEQGELERANVFLGHPYRLTGKVVPGRQLGRTVGVPTANLELPEALVQPRLGVYACKVTAEGRQYLAVTNVGSRPTVGGHHITVEPWLLDFSGDLYEKTVTVEFYKFLRAEEKFPDLEQLSLQIQKDAQKARKFFEKS